MSRWIGGSSDNRRVVRKMKTREEFCSFDVLGDAAMIMHGDRCGGNCEGNGDVEGPVRLITNGDKFSDLEGGAVMLARHAACQ